jgi:RNA polymerase sigma factor (sigma-70 family)
VPTWTFLYPTSAAASGAFRKKLSLRQVRGIAAGRHLLGMREFHSERPTDPVDAAEVVSGDHGLVSRMQAGDREAFSQLYRRHVHAVYAYSGRILQSRDDVEDVVQETFVTAWERLKATTLIDQSALPWLLTTARYKSFNRNRARTRRSRNESADTRYHGAAPAADELVLAEELRIALESAVAQLSEIDRTVYEICLVDGSTYDQAAEALDTTTSAVRNRLARIRQRLRIE